MNAARETNGTKEPMQVDAIITALRDAERTPGWNARKRDVCRFDLGDCVLIVVPARRWIYRRYEQQAAACGAWKVSQEWAS